VDLLAQVKGGITKDQKKQASQGFREIPYLRVANVQRGYLDLSEVAIIRASEEDIEDLRLEPGDVLFNEGGDRDKLGRGWVWSGEIDECIHQNHVFRARIYTDDLLPKFLSWYGNSSGQQYFFSEGRQTTNLASINSTKLRSLPVPVPPKAEQVRIVREVERVLSLVDESEILVAADLKRCQRLRQSILQWAFEGKLVDQDPTDEPASALLERLRAERAAAEPTKKTAPRPRQSPLRGTPYRLDEPTEPAVPPDDWEANK
jgi:type I restriction enzyme S subunit